MVAAGVLWGFAATGAQAPHPVSQSFGKAGALAPTTVVYNQPAEPEWWVASVFVARPGRQPADQWVWDGFTFAWTQAITQLQWRGGYDPAWLGSGGPVFNFTVGIYASIPAGSEPDVSQPPLICYEVGGNAE